ncbi:MAG: efflux RND transporter periplasmic adaptor subunit [Granulosicoccus sp.]
MESTPGHKSRSALPLLCSLASRRQPVLLTFTAFASIMALTAGLVPPSKASLEVLSDMDCVVEPSASIELGSAVPGLLAHSYFDRSDYVSAGTVMAELESNVERVALSIAEQVASSSTAVELRELSAGFGDRTRGRNAILLKTSGVSKQVMDQVNTEADIARLQVDQEIESQRLAELEVQRAQALLDRRQIRTPISGSVVQKFKSAGEYVDSDPVYEVAQLDPLHVEVIVPVDYLGNLETGMQAAVSIAVPGFENQQLEAFVRRIDSVADAASATYGVRLTLENPDLVIPSGVRCQVDFFAS